MQGEDAKKMFKCEGGRIYFTKRTERLFFFAMSLVVMAILGLTKMGVM